MLLRAPIFMVALAFALPPVAATGENTLDAATVLANAAAAQKLPASYSEVIEKTGTDQSYSETVYRNADGVRSVR